jgi:hypothetical protein
MKSREHPSPQQEEITTTGTKTWNRINRIGLFGSSIDLDIIKFTLTHNFQSTTQLTIIADIV